MCYVILSVKEFCDERLLVSDVIAQNDEYIKEKRRFQCYVLSDMEVYKNNDLNNINTYLYSGTTNSKAEGEVSRKQRPA